jgi:O-antigen/teichoic acid export membrane protein
MAITSVITMLSFVDLGMGNGLINIVAEANGHNNVTQAQQYVSSAFFSLCAIALILAATFYLVYPLVDWQWMFNVTSVQAIHEAGPALALFVGCFLLNLPLSVAQQANAGYQEGYVNHIWGMVSGVVGIGTILVAIYLQAGLPWLVLCMAGSTVLTSLLNSVALFGKRRPWLRPRLKYLTPGAMRRIVKVGGLFLALQIAVTVGYQSDNIVISRILGADQVTQYAVPQKLFMFGPTILSFILMPLWPAYGEALIRGDVAWVKQTLRRSIGIGLLINVSLALVLVLWGSQILRLWAGPEIQPQRSLLIGLGLWCILNGFGGPLAMFLNGANVIGFQVICALSMAAINLVLSIMLTQSIGVARYNHCPNRMYLRTVTVLCTKFCIATVYSKARPKQRSPCRSVPAMMLA